jgi:hypothetical protein
MRARGAASARARAAASPAGPPPTTQTSSASSRAGGNVAGASGSVPEPPISRTSFRNKAFPRRVPVISVWWSMPSGNSQSAAVRRSTSALGNAFCRSQRSPSRTGSMHARRLGWPSMRT